MIFFSHYREAFGAFLVYDITKERSFRNVASWLENLRSKNDHEVVVTVLGNKIDLSDGEKGTKSSRRVEYSSALEFSKDRNIFAFEETSALFDKEEIFCLLRNIVEGNLFF